MQKEMQKIILVTALALATAACSATGTATVTHAWNAEDKTTAEYRLDNFSCLDHANTTESDLMLNDSRFDSYKNCMLKRGYALRTY